MPKAITGRTSSNETIFTGFDSNTSQLVATWEDNNTSNPYYSTLSSSFAGTQSLNCFCVVSEWFNILSWVRATNPFVVGYHLYRNNTLIATLPSSAISYQDHDRKRTKSYIYNLVAFGSNGHTIFSQQISVGGQ